MGMGITRMAPPTSANAVRQPKLAISRCASIGITTAPRPRPTIIEPIANPRRRSNQRETTSAYGTVVVAGATTPRAR